MWDKEYGGFYWQVDARGLQSTMPHKHLYGQAFALFALSEYWVASQDTAALNLARRLFDLLDKHAWDSEYGGFTEFLLENWQAQPENVPSYLGTKREIKLMNTHIHITEALTSYTRVTNEPRARERLIELIFIMSNAVVNKSVGACSERFYKNWMPIRTQKPGRVSYGHDIENIWLLVEACNASNISSGPLLNLFDTLFRYSLKYGFDHKKGGFYESGKFNRKADKKDKIDWVQAEALVGALQMYELTSADIYSDCYRNILEWIMNYQVDWENGEWNRRIDNRGRSFGEKAGAWKAPYHSGRAMLQCLDLLE